MATPGKLNRELEAYRFQASGDTYPSYWDAQGSEIPIRLKDAPIEDYEQITALVGDGRGHNGMDFKGPKGEIKLRKRSSSIHGEKTTVVSREHDGDNNLWDVKGEPK